MQVGGGVEAGSEAVSSINERLNSIEEMLRALAESQVDSFERMEREQQRLMKVVYDGFESSSYASRAPVAARGSRLSATKAGVCAGDSNNPFG